MTRARENVRAGLGALVIWRLPKHTLRGLQLQIISDPLPARTNAPGRRVRGANRKDHQGW